MKLEIKEPKSEVIYEQKLFIYEKYNNLYCIPFYIFFIFLLGWNVLGMLLIIFSFDKWVNILNHTLGSICIILFFISLIGYFCWVMFPKDAKAPYKKCCQTCEYFKENYVLNSFNNQTSKVVGCNKFDNFVPLKIFKPCSQYKLSNDFKNKIQFGKK